MQLYVLDRAKNTLETTDNFYNDKHHKDLAAGASSFEFTIDKTEVAAKYLITGNYIAFQDDRGRAWSFTIINFDETQTTKTIYAQDVSIELLNKAVDVWNTTEAHSFVYYFDEVTKGTPWELGINQVADLSRKLVYTGRDTGLGRLLSILTGFDNAECKFNVVIKGNQPVKYVIDVYKSIGTVQKDMQIVYNEELDDIKKTESRAQFVTALAGVGGMIENQETTDPGLEKHVDFADIAYKDDNFISPKGDKFLRAVTANQTLNPGRTTYIEDFYEYDTQSPQELLNRTLTQLKERSEPQYTYGADVKVIDPALDIGDTVTIIDQEYNPALYLQARVATLDKSYSDPTQGAITFCNYQVLSSYDDQIRSLQQIINRMPTSESVKLINSNIIKIIATNEELKKQVVLALKSADGKSTIYFDAKPKTAKNGDVAFVKNADGVTEIWAFVEGMWTLDTGIATFDDVKKAASAAADAGSQAVIAGQQASAAGADAKSAGDFAASAASQSTIETAAAQSAANSAVDQANLAISQAGFANDAADQAKSAAASAKSDAADALAEATKSFNDAQNAISNATKAMDAAEQNRTTVTGLVTKVDDIAGTIQTLATTQSVDKLAGTVTTVQNLAQFAADGLKLKADTTTVNQINGTVNDLKGELDVQADKIAATVTASDVTGMLGNYATQSWSQGQISAAKNEISASVETVKNTVNAMSFSNRNLFRGYPTNSKMRVNKNNFYYYEYPFKSKGTRILLKPNTEYTVTWDYEVISGDMDNTESISVGRSNEQYDFAIDINSVAISDKKITIKTPADVSDGPYFALRFSRTDDPATSVIDYWDIAIREGNINSGWTPAPEDQATVDWTKSQLDIKDGKISAAVTSLKSDIATATAGMATQTWTQDQLSITSSSLTNTISGVSDIVANLSSRNYYQANTQISVLTGAPAIDHTDTTNGFRLVGVSDQLSSVRLSKVITGNGWWTFSFDLHANQESALIIDFCDLPPVTVKFTKDTKRYSLSVNVTNASASYDFIDISNLGWAYFWFDNVTVQKGKADLGWSPAPEDQATVADVSSQFTQLQNDINLRVKTGDLINQINVSTEGILIDGSKTHITNTTTIDNGVIKTASIADAAITTAKISELAVNTAQIANGAINSAKIASLAVGTAQIADGAISTAKIGTAAITSAQIADASILDAKIVNLDGSKIVAHSITADQLDVNAIAVGLNAYGSGWQITPASIAFLPPGTTKASLSLTGDLGIMFGDIGNGESLAVVQGTPYNTTTDRWYNGLAVNMLNNGDYFGLSADTGTTTEPKMIWSRSIEDKFNIKKGFSFYDDTFFAGNVTTTADLFINRIGVKDANNNGHTLKYNWVDGVGIAQIAGNGKAGVLIEEAAGDVKFMVDGSQYSLRDIITHAMHWA